MAALNWRMRKGLKGTFLWVPIGPLSADSLEDFSFSGFFSSFPDAPESPSTSGISSLTRRRREAGSGEETAAKRPMWSDESDSD